MKTLNLEFVNMQSDFVVAIDNKICDFQKPTRKNKNVKYEYKTENEKAHISIKRFVPIGEKNWWLWQLLFFFISIFGIFNFFENRKCIAIDFEADITLIEDTNIKIVVHQNSKDKKAVELLTEADVVELKNDLSINQKAKKRLKFIRVFTIVFWVLLVLGTLILVINKVIN